MRKRFVEKVWRSNSKRLELLRHSFITLLISKGIDIVTVSNLVGHSMPSTTINMYAHAVSERKASAVQAIGLAFEGMV